MCCKETYPTINGPRMWTVRKFRIDDGSEVWHRNRGPADLGVWSDRAILMREDKLDTFGNEVDGFDQSAVIRRRLDGPVHLRSETFEGAEFVPNTLVNDGFAFLSQGLYWLAGTAGGAAVVQAYDPETLEAQFSCELSAVAGAIFSQFCPSPHGALVLRRSSGQGVFTVERVDTDGTIGATATLTEASSVGGKYYLDANEFGLWWSPLICSDGKLRFLSIPWTTLPMDFRVQVSETGTDLALSGSADVAEYPEALYGHVASLWATKRYSSFDAPGWRIQYVNDEGTLPGIYDEEPKAVLTRSRSQVAIINTVAIGAGLPPRFGGDWPAGSYGVLIQPGPYGFYSWNIAGAVHATLAGPAMVDDESGARLWIQNGAGAPSGIGLSLVSGSGSDALWHTEDTFDPETGLGGVFWFPLSAIWRYITVGGYHYLVGSRFPFTPQKTSGNHVELVKVNASNGSIEWTARHSSDGASQKLFDVLVDGEFVYVCGEPSPYVPE